MDEGIANRIAIYGSRSQSESLPDLPAVFSFLNKTGFRIYIQSRFAEYLESNGVDMGVSVPVEKLPPSVSLVMSIGGDGTFLRAARWIGDREIPILGVNTGHLGFLSCCRLSGVEEMIGEVCKGNITVEKRMLLKVEGDGLPEDMWPYALNEITFLRDGSSMISVRTDINGSFLADYKGDGLIISTPTGSTAYSLSAGGPLMEPTIDCVCICPVAPHRLTLRPLVVGSDALLVLRPESRSGKFILSVDDRSVGLPASGEFRICKSPFSVLLIRKKDEGFASILREKLLWSR